MSGGDKRKQREARTVVRPTNNEHGPDDGSKTKVSVLFRPSYILYISYTNSVDHHHSHVEAVVEFVYEISSTNFESVMDDVYYTSKLGNDFVER